MKNIAKLLSLFVLFSFLVQSVMGCGPGTVDPLFSFSRHVDYPLKNYAKGNLGIVPTSYGRMSLFLFYRQLNNLPLSAKEQEQYLSALSKRISHSSSSDEKAVEQWKTSRAKVFAGNPKLEKEKRFPDGYFYYTNCLDDAFRTAANTLDARIKNHGLNKHLKEWLNGQDAVFANCGEGGKIPKKVADNAPDWLKKDRAYQIAAALLYSGKDAEARAEFQRIANDTGSNWNKTARFVVARTYIREASLIDDVEPDYTPESQAKSANSSTNVTREVAKSVDQKKNEKIELYQKAEAKLKEILADSSMKDFHGSANRLLGLVGFRAKPRDQRRKLAEALVQKSENANLYNDLVDYIWLLDKTDGEASEAGMQPEAKETEKAGLGADLTDWLSTYQAKDGFAHSLDKWKQTRSLAWFVAALSKAQKDSNDLAELLNEAEKIKAESPAFATAKHHQIRLLIETGKRAEAKQKLNEVIANSDKYARSTQNDFLSQRIQLAENLDEFLKFAQRQAATFVWNADANEEGDDLKDDKEMAVWKDRPMFDDDSVKIFNEKMPLSTLRQAALNPGLPKHLKKFLVIAVWTRAFVLGNRTIQTEFTPLMTKFAPEYKVSAANSEANSLLAVGRNPKFQIYVPTGYGRESDFYYEGDWWCVQKGSTANYPNFLTAAQQAEAASEQNKIVALGESATFLARRAVEFANKNMTHPNTPEILHLAVSSTRDGCKDPNTLEFSKAAFDILHKRFPRSEWTKKTPYFFGESEDSQE